MPFFKILMKCQLENITDLGVPSDEHRYQIKLKCGKCNEVSEKWQYVSPEDSIKMPGSRGTCNYMAKCKLCSGVQTLDVCLQFKAKYTSDDVPNFKTIIGFECRGMSVCEFRFGEGWTCKGTDSRTYFEDMDLGEDWCDYDAEANCPVSVDELEYKIM